MGTKVEIYNTENNLVNTITDNKFAYEGCHKIYTIEDEADEEKAVKAGYKILNISELADTYKNSCGLRFINNWKLDKTYVKQFQKIKLVTVND